MADLAELPTQARGGVLPGQHDGVRDVVGVVLDVVGEDPEAVELGGAHGGDGCGGAETYCLLL